MTGDGPLPLEPGDYHIPPQPRILKALHDIMAEPSPDALRIAALIADDVGLASQVLKTINSAWFGMRRHVSDIRQAAVLLGPGLLVKLVTDYEFRHAMPRHGCLQLGRFWDTATDTALVCALLGRDWCPSIPAEDLYTLGLFHDCGLPIMAQHHDGYRELLMEANDDYRRPITALEQARYGLDHSQVGYRMTETWGLPTLIGQAVLRNHERDFWSQCQDPALARMVAILKWAENLVDRERRQRDNPDWPWHRDGVMQALQAGASALEETPEAVQEALGNGHEPGVESRG